ncbi:hypothetical protein HQ576_03840 [bacterium]|nr:hypothetical protein [bacterium]
MSKLTSLLVSVAMVAGVCHGGTLSGVQKWAETVGPETVSNSLTRWGVANEEDRAAMTAAWDEDTVVDLALKTKAYYVLSWAGRLDRLSPESVQRIREALLAEEAPPLAAQEVVRYLPREARTGFDKMLYDLVARRYPANPVFGRHYVKHVVLEGGPSVSDRMDVNELLQLLVAPEPLAMVYTTATKKALKGAAVLLARAKLRADGKSFVVQDGVNPLAEAIRPVVDALNAPGCVGVEAALRSLGADIADIDRGGLDALAAEWQAGLMSGEMSSGTASAVLGKLSVALGVDGFNAFVDRYNNGTEGSGDGTE